MTLSRTPSVAQVARLGSELNERLQGGVIQALRVAGQDLVVLSVRVPGRTHQVGLSVHRDAAGPILFERRPPRDPDAMAGTNFWDLARSGLLAAGVESVEAPSGERSLLFHLRRGHERALLAVTFHGAQPNLVLLRDDRSVGDLRARVSRNTPLADFLRGAPNRAAANADDVLALDTFSSQLRDRRRECLASSRLDVLRRGLDKALKTAETRLERRTQDVARLGQSEELRREAEALAASLHEVQKGAALFELSGWPDPQQDEPICLKLDPARTPADNLQRLWQKVRKADRGREEAQKRVQETEDDVLVLSELLERAQALTETLDLDALDALVDQAGPRLPVKKPQGKKKSQAAALPFKRYLSKDGLPILVGRSSKANDELTFRVGNGNDLWLHARDVPGSHVVVRLPKKHEVPQETLLDAATLAHLASKRKSDRKGDVTWCRVKDVSKRKGMPAGQVLVAHEKTIRIAVEEDRVARLKATEDADA